ncbi:fungal-specific transcription factor domain-containing protein [Boeremia exigua]|uniref:fungal-specific transcription factor domain-containing protein n=1 Tax=Boeremia exigua TaxID=749465 RepID=UPI001E8EB783|nr:fungal-specific transcription factor domain-containing protein [Boeremia exigua]KAH6644189.1 fungal-specific transcription factor domain-containing protein [Boeremia exigua]
MMMFTTLTSDMNVIDIRSQKSRSTAQSKRAQVARACNYCRTNRIKCDEDLPCTQCRQRGLSCDSSSKTAAVSVSLPAASRKNQRLKERIKELEGQLKQKSPENSGDGNTAIVLASQAQAPDTNKFRESSPRSESGPTRIADRDQVFGPARDGPSPLSLTYLVKRLLRHLCENLDRSSLDFTVPQVVEPMSNSALFTPSETLHALSRTEEELFLYPLWESFHPIYPVLSYEDFHHHYNGLWISPPEDQPRSPSALVDSLLAVCTQYSSTFMHDDSGRLQDYPVTRVGYPYYFRSQSLLAKELESPSITTVQAFVYCIIYLYNSSLLNTAYHTLGMAVRVLHTLHLDSLSQVSTTFDQQDQHARIFWTLYRLDMAISMSLDRPFLVRLEDVPYSLPEKADNNPHIISSPFLRTSANLEINWMSFHMYRVRLAATFHGITSDLQKRLVKIRQGSKSFDIHDEPAALEDLAMTLEQESDAMNDWVKSVPELLKVRRHADSEPLSTDRVSLNLDSTSPIWLQRQQLILELTYHDNQLSIHRPFLRISLKTSSFQPHTDRMGLKALSHALAITDILQALSGTEILRGWLPLVRLQWNAVLCILCFVIGNPICPFTAAARKGLQAATQFFENVGNYFPSAHSAVSILNYLMSLGDSLTARYRRRIDPRSSPKTTSKPWSETQQIIPSSGEIPMFSPSLDDYLYPTLTPDVSRPMSSSSLDTAFPFTHPSGQMTHTLPDSFLSQELLNLEMMMNYGGNDKPS